MSLAQDKRFSGKCPMEIEWLVDSLEQFVTEIGILSIIFFSAQHDSLHLK